MFSIFLLYSHFFVYGFLIIIIFKFLCYNCKKGFLMPDVTNNSNTNSDFFLLGFLRISCLEHRISLGDNSVSIQDHSTSNYITFLAILKIEFC